MSFINKILADNYVEVAAKEFYRDVFPIGELASEGTLKKGTYFAIAVELLKKEKNERQKVKRYLISDDLDRIDELLQSENFIIISPISYAGKRRTSENARYMYGIAIDLDGITEEVHLLNLLHQMENVRYLPKATYLVSSGSGLHLYYLFKEPVPCFQNIAKQLAGLKNELTRKIWKQNTTSLSDNVQIESLFQGFRLVGGVTKAGDRTRAYKTGEKVDIDYLNGFVKDEFQVKEYTYKSKLTLKQAKELYPGWYEKRIIKGQPKGAWVCSDAVYYWWKNRILEDSTVGHRYFSVMCLAVYAKKSGISRQRLERDAFELVEYMDSLTVDEDNHFTADDVLSAIEMYNDNYFTFPIDTISELTDIKIEKNKRNGRTREQHLKFARGIKALKKQMGEAVSEGRPKGSSKQKEIVIEWRTKNPAGKKVDCIKETGINRKTISRWWNEAEKRI